MAGAGATTSSMVIVPNIEGRIDARDILIRTGLRPVDIPVHGPIDEDAKDIGEAYRQNPKPGTAVPKGAPVSYRSWWEAR